MSVTSAFMSDPLWCCTEAHLQYENSDTSGLEYEQNIRFLPCRPTDVIRVCVCE